MALFVSLCVSPALAQEQQNGASANSLPPEQLFGMQLEDLLNVKVYTPTKKSEKRHLAPATVVVITRQQIRERGYETLEDALRDLPGFDLVHVQGTWPTIWAQRGLYGDENKRTLVLIDGIVENNLLEGSVLGGPQYSLNGVERIEVTYGPGSALFGANAFSGVINIVTMRGRQLQGLEYQKGAGSFRTRFDKLAVGGEAHGVDVFMSGSLYDSNGPVFPDRHPSYSNSYVDNAYSLVTRLRYHGLTLGFSRFDRPMGEGEFSNRPGYYGLPGYGFQDAEGNAGGMLQADYQGNRPSLWHSYTQTLFLSSDLDLADNVQLYAVAFHRNSGIAPDSYEYDYRGPGVAISRDPYTHDSGTMGAELRLTLGIDSHQDIVAGSQYEWSDIERGYRGTRTVVDATGASRKILLSEDQRVGDAYANAGAYAQYQLRTSLLRLTNLTLGARVDRSNRYGGTFNPRAGLVVSPIERLTLKLLAATAYRAPNSFEMFTETNVRMANPNLVPERETSLEASASLALGPRVLVEASAFDNHFTDIIVSNNDTDLIIPGTNGERYKQNQNVGSAHVTGLELRASAFLTDELDMFANFTLQDGWQRDSSRSYEMPNVAHVKGNLGATLRIPDLFSVYLVNNWVGERNTAPTNPDGEVPGYLVTNLALFADHFPVEAVGLLLRVDNLFDLRYVDPGIRSADASYYSTTLEQPGRTAYVKMILTL